MAHYRAAVLLVPMMSWAAPANRNETRFLWPTLRYCSQRIQWVPKWVVADMAYISLSDQRRIREECEVGVITKFRSDMKWMEPYTCDGIPRCMQGQRLEWLGYDAECQHQWFGAPPLNELCPRCWQQTQCPREFAYPASNHEILFGILPHAAPLAKHLVETVRPWIEPAQSFETHQLGLSSFFLNSLRIAWIMSLLADAVVLLRAHALLAAP